LLMEDPGEQGTTSGVMDHFAEHLILIRRRGPSRPGDLSRAKQKTLEQFRAEIQRNHPEADGITKSHLEDFHRRMSQTNWANLKELNALITRWRMLREGKGRLRVRIDELLAPLRFRMATRRLSRELKRRPRQK
jgi:hypothetical protein